MKFLVISDLEGKFPNNLKKFCKKENIEFILSPGDFGDGDLITPLIFKHWGKNLEDVLGVDKLNNILKNEYIHGIQVLKLLNKLEIPIYIIFGNHDYNKRGRIGSAGKYRKVKIRESYGDFVKRLQNIKHISRIPKKINDFNLISLDISQKCTITKKEIQKMKTKKARKVKKSQEKFRELMETMLRRKKNVILMTHQPPSGCKLGKINNKKSPRDGDDVGNVILREMIEKYQPLLSVSGHMHENQGVCKIGKTTVVNSGFGKKGEAAVIELPDLKVRLVKIK